MKKFFYTFSFILLLFIGINGVKAEPKEVLNCTYSINSTRKYTLKVYSDSSTNKLSSQWEKPSGDTSGISLPDITPTSTTKCPTIYYQKKDNSYVTIEKFLEEKDGNCTGSKCSQKELSPSKKTINSDSGSDVDDQTKKTLMLTCNYDNNIVLKIYDDKTFQMIGGNSTCSFSKTTLSKLECPSLGITTNGRGDLCKYALESDSTKNNSSKINFNSGEGSKTYTEKNGEYHSTLDGSNFKDLTCNMYGYLRNSPNYNASAASGLINFSDCQKNFSVPSDELKRNIADAASKITAYCNSIYSEYNSYKDNDSQYNERLSECTNFASFYDSLVSSGIVSDARTEGCGFLSGELGEKVRWVFNLIKIAGPILAIALGMLDFVKVIINNDADKEMKTAWKRLIYRLIAAALLFIIPVLLAWMMDTVLEETEYDSSNPFCGMNEWSENN